MTRRHVPEDEEYHPAFTILMTRRHVPEDEEYHPAFTILMTRRHVLEDEGLYSYHVNLIALPPEEI